MSEGIIIESIIGILIIYIAIFIHNGHQQQKEMEDLENRVNQSLSEFDKRITDIENTKTPITDQIRQEMKSQFQIEAAKNQYIATKQSATGKHAKKEEEK